MSNLIGRKSKKDWRLAKDDATHVTKFGVFYKYEDNKCYVYGTRGEYWSESENGSRWLEDNLISKDEDLEMYKKEISCIEDLQTGMFVFMQGGHSAYVNIDDRGRIGFLFTNQHSDVNYTMQSAFDGLEYSPNKDISITHWGYSLAGERYLVATSEADIKIKELEATIALAQKQLQEYKEMK
jgi:hypothetical protein